MSIRQYKKIDLLKLLIKPVVKFAIRQGFQFQETSHWLKVCFIEEAKNTLEKSNQKINISKLSAATGLQRKDLKKSNEYITDNTKLGLLSKVIGLWNYSKEYTNKSGTPLPLTYAGKESEFASLVSKISNDLHPGTILAELERKNIITKNAKKIKLNSQVVDLKQEPFEAFKLLSSDNDDLIKAVENNVLNLKVKETKETPNLHASTEFTSINIEKIEEIKKWLILEGSKFHKNFRDYLSKYDLDFNTSDSNTKDNTNNNSSLRVVLGTFSLIEKEEK